MKRSLLMDLNAQIEANVPDIRNRNRIATVVVAAAIANTRHLPSAQAENPPGYYIDQVYPMTLQLISDFNETVVIDTDLCAETARQLWMMRHAAAFPTIPVYQEGAYFFDALNSVTTFVSEDTRVFVAEAANAAAILKLLPTAIEAINELKGG